MLRPIPGAAAAAAVLGLAAACSPGGEAGKAAGPAAPPAPRFVSFADPAERAFTLEVPAGWAVTGGSRRMSAVEIRSSVRLRSPDGTMELFVGDNDVPVFAVPSPLLAMGGFREGATYSPGYGQSFVVAPYRPAEAFAASWGQGRIGAACPDATLQASRALPEATQAIDMAYARGGVRTSIRAGEARFACRWGGAPGAGYVMSATELVEAGGGALWSVKALAGFAARADRAGEAAAVLSRVVGSFRVDPQWAAAQGQLTGDVSRIVAGTNAAVSRSISQAYETRQAASDRSMQGFAEATRGTATFVDPVQGRRELPNAEHVWRLPDGRTVGTTGSDPPVPGAQELQRVR